MMQIILNISFRILSSFLLLPFSYWMEIAFTLIGLFHITYKA
jgi:hypothetical protein